MSLTDDILAKISSKHVEKMKKFLAIYEPVAPVFDITVGFIAEIKQKDRRKCCRCQDRPQVGCRVYASTVYGHDLAYICQNCVMKHKIDYGDKAYNAMKENLCSGVNKICYPLHLTSALKDEK